MYWGKGDQRKITFGLGTTYETEGELPDVVYRGPALLCEA